MLSNNSNNILPVKTGGFLSFIRKINLVPIVLLLGLTGCSEKMIKSQDLKNTPPELNLDVVKRLNQKTESENLIFYHRSTDTLEIERSESYLKWALDYLNISLDEKIKFFKFKDRVEMGEAFGKECGGVALLSSLSLATHWSWQNHEVMHLLSYQWSNFCAPPSFFMEGIAVATQIDPYTNDYQPRFHDNPEDYISWIKRLKNKNLLHPLEDLLESKSFWEKRNTERYWITYPQSGIFTLFLIQTYNLETYKKIYKTVLYEDTKESINNQFIKFYGKEIKTLEEEWLLWLETN